jgi:hypothetical protein
VVTPFGAQRDHQVFNPAQSALAFADNLGLETGLSVPGHLDVDRSDLSQYRLGSMSVATVAAVAAGWVACRVAEVVAHLPFEGVFQHQLGQLL